MSQLRQETPKMRTILNNTISENKKRIFNSSSKKAQS